MKLLLDFWQLPQHLLAFILLLFLKSSSVEKYKTSTVFWVKDIRWGISLGRIIILSTLYDKKTVKHEYGHSIQSKIFGPLYLIVIGLPSITMNILSQLNILDPLRYYKRWPENWANKLGKVERNY